MKNVVMTLVIVVGISVPVAGGDTSAFHSVLEHYEPVRLALLNDSMVGVSENGKVIASELRALKAGFSADRAGATGEAVDVVREKLDEMITAADAIAAAKTLEAARDGLYALSKPMVRWREGVTANDRPSVAYCPMHKRSWLQPGEEIGNPYGDMPRCGSIVSK